MKNFRMYPSSINGQYVDEIVEILRRGGVIIYPTDSMYAIGCDALQNRAVERVCRLRDINPAKQNLSVVCGDISQASDFARIDNVAFRLMKANLPGPFTFVLPATTRLSKAFKGRREVGVRVPDNSIATAIADALGSPILSATALCDGHTDFDELARPEVLERYYHGAVDAIVDGGDAPAHPTAVVSLTGGDPEILREGPLPLSGI